MNTIRNSLNYAYLKAGVSRAEIDLFKTQVSKLLNSLQENETEEFHKNHLADFLKYTYYKDKHYINTKGTNDLVIHNDKTVKSSVGVIIEVKRPSNNAEMVSCDNLNKKALQELVLYYLRERITHKNLQIKHLIITNIHDWFIFDARVFESCFTENKSLVKLFNEFENGTLAGNTTQSFYKAIAAPAIETCTAELQFTHFNLTAYQALLENTDQEQDKQLIPLFKLLSPEHLLKLPFSNDANSLNQAFYNELLHIIGLEEVNEGGKKLIKRKEKERHSASFLEQAIGNIQNRGEITQEQPLFDAAIELSITWINRILFLKLLEAQLMTYHKQDKLYQFFTIEKITCFADLNYLFFDVLAIKEEDRNNAAQQNFAHIPYLNSSLFERTELENRTLEISGLRRETLPILSTSVLKNSQGYKLTDELDILSYLFSFLEAYDFSNDSNAAIKDQPKSLISASVLGLIFEKINGYKDGSFFTPSVITMYMSRETMRLAVLQKFNERKGWQCQSFDDLKNSIIIYTKENRKEANDIINSIKVCDPAVGSGHFLVSVLNEFIAIKSELRVLVDSDYTGLSYLQVTVYNDELKITRADDDNIHFEYSINSKESQRVQKTLFHEKQTIIENCLFGVDINPNSVKICRLRLWIELLKSAYYRDDGKLETLPNIDINIQCGNSLISRFQLDADLKSALKKSNINIEDYKKAFHSYQNAKSKQEKKEMEHLIKSIKDNFYIEAYENDPNKKLLTEKIAAKNVLTNYSWIEKTEKEKLAEKKALQKIELEIIRLTNEIENFRNNPLYKNASEWRFEFPEALDNEGNFIGFDVIIGNPPYIFARNSKDKGLTQESKVYFYNNFELAEYQVNLYPLFIELGHRLLKENGIFSYITPNNWLTINTNKKLRQFVLSQSTIKIVNFYAKVFDSAAVDSAIVLFKKSTENHTVELMEYIDDFKVVKQSIADDFLNQKDYLINIDYLKNTGAVALIDKIELNTVTLSLISDIKVGLKTYQIGKGNPLQTNELKENRAFHSKIKINDSYLKYFDGKDICRYFTGWSGEYLKYGNHLAEPRSNFNLFSTKRILVRQIPSKLPYCVNACLVDEIALNDLNSMNIINMKEIPELILAVLNSKLMSYWFFHKFGKMQRDTFPQFKINELAIFPMPKSFEPHRENLIALVEQIMAGKKAGKDTRDLEVQIDTLVYALYGLSAEEIALVEAL